MKISQEVREFARLQNQPSDGFIAAEEAEKGMAEMSKAYDDGGRELYGAGDRSTTKGAASYLSIQGNRVLLAGPGIASMENALPNLLR